MEMQTAILRKDLENQAEFIFVNGPYEIPKLIINDPKVINNIKGKPYAWYQSQSGRILCVMIDKSTKI